MKELKSCPFCNGKAKFEVIDTRQSTLQNGAMRFTFVVKCGECGAELPNLYACDVDMDESGEIHTYNDRRYDATNDWNRWSTK